jgi:hypothetical protein
MLAGTCGVGRMGIDLIMGFLLNVVINKNIYRIQLAPFN